MFRVLLVLSLAACASAPPVEAPVAEQIMTEVAQRLEDSDLDGAADQLFEYEETSFLEAWQPRYAVLRARIHLQQKDPWEAYLALREFADNHPHSELRNDAIALQFEAGQQLALSDGGFLFFWSDKRGARTCLEHLTTRYPNCPQFPEAMQLLGKLALEKRDYQLAEERYRELLRRFPESEWAPLARFQFAMSIYLSLRGADYDLDRMESASRELDVYLQGNPENPDYRAQAEVALETLRNWRAERHLSIAAFYQRVDNRPGEVEHLHLALASEFAGTWAADDATERLHELGDPKPAAQLPPRPPTGTKP
jgi:outer membrane protein assembly factor BamD (BamD/ComL family)